MPILPLAQFIPRALADRTVEETIRDAMLGRKRFGEVNAPLGPVRGLNPDVISNPPGRRYMGVYVPGNYGVGGQTQMGEPTAPPDVGGIGALGEMLRAQMQAPRREITGGPGGFFDQASMNRAGEPFVGNAWIAPPEQQPTGGPMDLQHQEDPGLPPPLAPGVDLMQQRVGPTQAQQAPTAQDFMQPQRQPSSQDFGVSPVQPQQPQQGGLSDPGMWGLLAAGLGILANNSGHYGNWQPAVGKGGLIGVNTFLNQRQQGIENVRRDELAKAEAERWRAQARYNDQILGVQRGQLSLKEQENQRQLQQDEARQALALSLAGQDPEAQKLAVADTDGFLKHRIAQMKPEYRERTVKEGKTAFDEFSSDGGKTWHKVPGGGTYDLGAARGGTNVNVSQQTKTTENFNEQSAKEQAKSLISTFDTLQTIPSQLMAMEEAEKALKAAGGFVGSGGETKLAIAKFFNNNFGTEIAPDQVANAEVLRSTLFRQIMENLKKLDSQPSQQQQKVMQESLGNLGTDPNAIPQIIRITRQALSSRAKEHNRRVREAKKNDATFLYDITIPGFDEPAGKDPWEK